MSILNYCLTNFIYSAPSINYLPKDNGLEIAFAGYSNVGKSSSLNALTNQKNLAYKSKTPGSTVLINVFEIENNKRLIDLPGYGYAKIGKQKRYKLQLKIYEYLQNRISLKGLIILIDIRRLLRDIDQKIISIAIYRKIPILILLNKADKLSYSQCLMQLKIAYKNIIPILDNMNNAKIEIFSASKKIGLDTLKKTLDKWFF